MCRSLAGSNDDDDPEPHYRKVYLKHDMQYECWEDTHNRVLYIATFLWFMYGFLFPIALAVTVGRHKARQEMRRLHTEKTGSDENRAKADYWTSTQPVRELFWMPVVSHLQPKHWC